MWFASSGTCTLLVSRISRKSGTSSARIAVITLVVLAGGSGSVEFRSQTTSPVPASMMTAARAVMYGPAARPGTGAALAQPSTTTTPAVLTSRILHPPTRLCNPVPTGDYSHVKARGSSKNEDRGIRRGAERCRRAQSRWGARGAEPVARGSPATRERPGAAQSTPADGRCSLPPAPHVGPYGTRPPLAVFQ